MSTATLRACSLVIATTITIILAACGGGDNNSDSSVNASPTMRHSCADILKGTPPAKPTEIGFAGSTGAEGYAGVFTQKVMPEKYHPNLGKWYTFKLVTYAPADRPIALASGEVSGLVSSAPQSWLLASQGLDIKLAATILEAPPDSPPDHQADSALVVRSDSPIHGFKDLEGKKVALLGLQTSMELGLRAGILAAGGNPRDVKPVALAPTAEAAAVLDKQVDAALLVQPFQTLAMHQGGLRKIGTQVQGLRAADPRFKTHPGVEVYFSDQFLEKHPAAVCAWVSDLQTEFAEINRNPARWRKAWLDAGLISAGDDMAAFLKTPKLQVPSDPGKVNLSSQKVMADLAIKTGMVEQDQVPDWSDFVWSLASTK